MSLLLNNGTFPKNIEIKTFGTGRDFVYVYLGYWLVICFSQEEFSQIVEKYITDENEYGLLPIFLGGSIVEIHSDGKVSVKPTKEDRIVTFSKDDWGVTIQYVFTNTNLRENDPRKSLVTKCQTGLKVGNKDYQQDLFKRLSHLTEIEGYLDTFSNQPPKRLSGIY